MTEEVNDPYIKTLDEREAFYKSQLTQYTENLKRIQEAVGVLNGGIQGIQEAKSLYLKQKEMPVTDEPVTDETK